MAEKHALYRVDAETNAHNHVQVVVIYYPSHHPVALPASYLELSDSGCFVELLVLINVLNVLMDGSHILIKKLSYLSLGQPDCIALKLCVNLNAFWPLMDLDLASHGD